PRLASVRAAAGRDERDLLAVAAALEVASEHPLAAAIVDAARGRGIEPRPADAFASVPGKGVTGTVDGRRAALGNAAFLADLGADAGALAAEAEALRRDGQTVVFVA